MFHCVSHSKFESIEGALASMCGGRVDVQAHNLFTAPQEVGQSIVSALSELDISAGSYE